MNRSLTLLHTSLLHIPVFDALRDREHPGAVLHHVVRPALLARARAAGPEAVVDELRGLLWEAGASGGTVLCTCSTVGGAAEALAGELGVAVLRVDRPMAAEAVRLGPRIVVLATLESTVGPTVELIREEARAGGREVAVRTAVVPGAFDRFEAGDLDGSLALVTAAADAYTRADTDVIVLAQVSMAGAAAPAGRSVPVLAGPALGLAAALRME
ncbi:aspartate/glutamate racemase family protein [Streptomyces sp. NPDC048603]|uniref:aspartate/glutamate racemase family protein n=1 Tax=Streptomyces sp. NPDC048603 TaxID=3365577 RepID=UPI00371C94EC